MRIGVMGTGDVGRVLAAGFRQRGHDVVVGTRDPGREDLAAWASGADVALGSFEEAAEAKTAVLATNWGGTENALRLAGPERLAGKTVIDVTNPLQPSPDGPPTLALGHTDSGGEQVQRWLPEAHVVKAWNIVGNPFMVDPQFPEGPPTMWICGDHDAAKDEVRLHLEAFGWPDVVDLGPITMSRYLEPLAMVWIHTGFRTGHWAQALRMLRG